MANDAMTPGVKRYVDAVTEFIFVEDAPQKADIIFVPGSPDPRHAVRAAELYCERYAPYVLPSGRFSRTEGRFAGLKPEWAQHYPGPFQTEWDFLRMVLIKHGVPEENILREDQATYTWENARFSRRLTDAMGLEIRRAILCTKPWHARRALMYYQAAYPDTEFLLCPAHGYRADRDNWYASAYGRERVLGEVLRLGGQAEEVFTMMVQQSGGDIR